MTRPALDHPARTTVLGLRQNLAQFTLLVVVNALLGGTLGQERTVLPLLATEEFGLDLCTSSRTYILALGMAKAATGHLAAHYGLRPAPFLLAAGTAMVHPTLLVAIGDVGHRTWRSRSVGIYRLWRDGGFAVGAVVSGLVADAFGIPAAVAVVAVLTAAAGGAVAARMPGRDHTGI